MYKIPTILGIVFIFGFFFWDLVSSDASDPTKIVLSGNDTLGRDWGAMAEQKLKDQQAGNGGYAENATLTSSERTEDAGSDSKKENEVEQDPLLLNKRNSYSYTSIPSPDGREIITGIDNTDQEENPEDKYMSRHSREQLGRE